MSATEGRGSGASGRAVQQAPGLWRTDLQRRDLSVSGREVIQSRVDIGPEAPLVKHTHTHPGEEIIYILEGSLEYQIDGQAPMTVNAGDALTVPAGVVHAVRNVGSGNAAELATYVVEKESRCSRWLSDPTTPAQGTGGIRYPGQPSSGAGTSRW